MAAGVWCAGEADILGGYSTRALFQHLVKEWLALKQEGPNSPIRVVKLFLRTILLAPAVSSATGFPALVWGGMNRRFASGSRSMKYEQPVFRQYEV